MFGEHNKAGSQSAELGGRGERDRICSGDHNRTVSNARWIGTLSNTDISEV